MQLNLMIDDFFKYSISLCSSVLWRGLRLLYWATRQFYAYVNILWSNCIVSYRVIHKKVNHQISLLH